MLTFLASKVSEFKHTNKSLSYGKAFYKFMQLEKITDAADKAYCDRIYNEKDENKVKAMIVSRLKKG